MMKYRRSVAVVGLMALVGLGLSGCGGNWGGNPSQQQYPRDILASNDRVDPSPAPGTKDPSILGDDGLTIGLFGDSRKKADNSPGIGVNAILWRASLETLSFMPLASADPFGGVIITDWYAAPDRPTERMKATVYILGKTLTADALKVSLFRQTKGIRGQWQDAAVAPETVTQLENSILTKARQIRVRTIGQ